MESNSDGMPDATTTDLPVVVLHCLRLGVALLEEQRGRVSGHAVERAQTDRLPLKHQVRKGVGSNPTAATNVVSS